MYDSSANIPWTDEEAKLLSELIAEEHLYREISNIMHQRGYNRTPEAIRKFYKRKIQPIIEEGLDSIEKEAREFRDPREPKNAARFYNAIEDIRAMRDKLISITTDKFVKMGRPVETVSKVLSISDLHCPFENPSVIHHALENHGDADVLVVNGDLVEHYAVSSWPKEKAILLKWEYKIALEWLKLFSKTFPKVVLTEGNHEHRLRRYFSANIDPVASFLVSPDMLSHLAAGHDFDEETGMLKPMHDFSNVYYKPGPLSFYVVIGKTVFVHPWNFSGRRGATALRAMDYFSDRENFECVVISHTHKMSYFHHRHKLAIEQGCCCVPLDYESDGKMTMQPQSFGYAVVYMDKNGHVDFDKSRPVYYGTGTPVKVEDAMALLR